MESDDRPANDGLMRSQNDAPQNRPGQQRPGDSRPGGGRTSPDGPQGQGDKDGGDQRFKQQHVWHLVAYVIVALIGLYIFQQFLLGPLTGSSTELQYSDFKAKVAAGQVATVTIQQQQISGKLKATSTDSNATSFHTYYDVDADPDLVSELQAAGVEYSFSAPASPIGGILLSLLPFLLIGLVWYIVYKRMVGLAGRGGGAGGLFGVGKSKATKVEPEKVGVTFSDVGGADEAIAELQEIIQFLKTPEQFARLGGRIPKGVLLVGPPGTGKTLLAKATAGEAGVDFFESSGSEFVEMFVGVGAARVRDLFEQARKSAPAIVFIDEIDAIGQSRGIGLGQSGMNDEREQTLNQLLAEIDGFSTDASRPVIIMAATNRPEVLDQALLRAGRFDRHVEVGNPDLIGRVQILKIHSKGIKLAHDFDIERAARITPGFSGADLANAMNEAALLAARTKSKAVTIKDFETAMERVVAGLEKKSRLLNAQEKKTVAYHESGHALIAGLVPHADPVAKISIIPHARGALGFTMQMPAEDRYILTQDELLDRVAVMLGGRAAEQTVFNVISTGASDDIQKATELVRRMVTEFGMSDKLGSVRYAGRQLQYIGDAVQSDGHLSPHTQQIIDNEIQRMVTEQYDRARDLLDKNREALESLASDLLEHETLDGSAVQKALGKNEA